MSYASRYQYLLKPTAWSSSMRYDILQNKDEEETDERHPTAFAAQQRWAYLKLAFSGIIILSLILGAWGLGYQTGYRTIYTKKITAPPASSPGQKQCGSSPTEARERGCKFEPMLSAWVPPACSFQEIVDEYQLAYGDIHDIWPWYADYNLTQRVTGTEIDVLRAGNYSIIYTTFPASHDLHCLYTWRKVSHALGENLPLIDARSGQFYHNTHCAQHVTDMLYHPQVMNDTWTFPLMYHDCIPIVSHQNE